MTYLVYILKSDTYSYVGMTNDFFKRWRQHNKEIKGGAKYTSKREEWYPICIIDGFETMKEAMQCEWAVKHKKKKKHKYGPVRRILNLNLLLKTSSHDQLSEILNSIHNEMVNKTSAGPPLTTPLAAPLAYASAPPPQQDLKEVVIRTG